MEYLYRYWARPCMPCFELTDEENNTVLEPTAYPIIKKTPTGVWIDDYDRKRFVSFRWRKQWASKTLEEAKVGFLKRKRCHLSILKEQLEQVTKQLLLAEQGNFSEKINGIHNT